jgi:hypothetical protein
MTGRNTPALYEDPSRVSRMVVISCAAFAALLTFLIILPPLLSLLGHRNVAASHIESDDAASAARAAAAASLDQLSRTARPILPADDVAGVGDSGAAGIAETTRTIVSSGVEASQRVPQESSALASGANGRSPEKPSAWVEAVQSTPDPGPTVEVDAEPVALPPLPRVRPHHHVAVAGVSAIPLPPPRPSVSTEAASTEHEAAQQRFDPF